MMLKASDHPWEEIVLEARQEALIDPILTRIISNVILDSEGFTGAISKLLAFKLHHDLMPKELLIELLEEFWASGCDKTKENPKRDLVAVRERDPACTSYLEAMLYLKGFHALQAQRVTSWLWKEKRQRLALAIQSRISEVFYVDIHPAAKIGNGIVIDHATNVVIGETAVLGNDITLLQGVTLGGTGKERGDRHPKVKDGARIWAGAIVLGNITIGESAQIGAGSVMLNDVPANTTVVGVPAQVVDKRLIDRKVLTT